MSSARLRREYGAVLDSLEAGWAALRSLQVEAEAIMAWRRSEDDVGLSVADFVDISVTDEFRDLAFHCREAILGDGSGLQAELADQGEAVLRALRLLGMAANSPEFPLSLREHLPDALAAFEAWSASFRAVLAPLERRSAAGHRP